MYRISVKGFLLTEIADYQSQIDFSQINFKNNE